LAGDCGPLWRVAYGIVCLDRPQGVGSAAFRLVQLALPGDLVGLEALCDQPYRLGASALTPARLDPVDLESMATRERLLQQAVMQLQRRSLDIAALRTGPVPERVAYLLRLLGHDTEQDVLGVAVHADAIRTSLPRLRELAGVVDAKTETVCRALARLLPPRSRRSGPARATLLQAAPAVPWQAPSRLAGLPV
jgi:CRP-like cAMP-binding protein